MKARRYSLEFKRRAVVLATAPEASIRSVAKDLGVHPQTLEYWIAHPPTETRSVRDSIDTDDPVALKLRLKEAEARIRRLEMEQEILKKATAFFARENL